MKKNRSITEDAALARLIPEKQWLRSAPLQRPLFRQHRLKTLAAAAGTRIVAAKLLAQLLVTMDDAIVPAHLGFGWISLAAFGDWFKSRRFPDEASFAFARPPRRKKGWSTDAPPFEIPRPRPTLP